MQRDITVTVEIPPEVIEQAEQEASTPAEIPDHVVDRLSYSWETSPGWKE